MSNSGDNRTYNVTAVYGDMDRARRGVEVLEEHGVDADDIFLGGRAGREAATTQDTEQRDKTTVDRSQKTALRGFIAGGITGAVLGLILGLIFLSDRPAGILALTIGSIFPAGGVGLFVFSLANQKQSQAWEATLEEDTEGAVVVGVHTENPETFATAAEALAGTNPEKLNRFDVDGNPLSDSETAGG
jgi:hypothetical protein